MASFGQPIEWSWTGPNGFVHTGRELTFYPVVSMDTGQYIVTYSAYGCSASDTFNIIQEPVTAIQDSKDAFPEVLLYPNPTQDQVTIEFSEACEDILLELYDHYGRLLKRKRASSKQIMVLNLGGLPDSNYILRIRTEFGSTLHQLAVRGD